MSIKIQAFPLVLWFWSYVILCIFGPLFGGDLGGEMTPTPFKLLRLFYGPFELGKLVSCVYHLSYASCVGILGHWLCKV